MITCLLDDFGTPLTEDAVINQHLLQYMESILGSYEMAGSSNLNIDVVSMGSTLTKS